MIVPDVSGGRALASALSTPGIDRPLKILHVATLNKPITPHLGYGPIETVIGNIHKGLTAASDSGFARRAPTTLMPAAIHFAAISDYQRRQYAHLVPIAKIVPHGLDLAGYPFQDEVDAASYLFSIARITRVKGQDTAIEVARASGSKLILAGCVQDKTDDRVFFEEMKRRVDLVVDVSRHPVDGAYYDEVMKPILSCDRQIVYIGEVDTEAKKHWYRHAKATLFPVRWGEPFGMVLIESMACGTPIIAFGEGAVPEIVMHGATGFVVASRADMVAAVALVEQIDRRTCRADVAARFSIERMSARYAGLYQSLARNPTYRSAQPFFQSLGATGSRVSES